MSKILVCCPSKGRYSSIMRHTCRFLMHESFKYDWFVFVEPQDFDKYSKVLPSERLINVKQNDKGLFHAKKTMKIFAEKNGYDYIFKIDDDVNNIRIPELIGSKGKNTGLTKEEILSKRVNQLNNMLSDSLEMFDLLGDGVKGVTVMYGHQYNNYTGEKWLRLNNWLQSNYIVHKDFFAIDEHKNIKCFEDLITHYYILKQGYFTIKYGLTALDVMDVGKNEGGLQLFDRKSQAMNDKKEIEDLYPDISWKKVDGKTWEYEPDFSHTKGMKSLPL